MARRRNISKRRPSPPQRKEGQPLDSRAILAKAATMTGNAVDESSAIQDIKDTEEAFSGAGAIVPDYDPESLLTFIELSPHLSPNIAAYVQNIEGYGHQPVVIEPWMDDLESEEAFDAVKQAMIIERWVDQEDAALAEQEEKTEMRQSLKALREKEATARKEGRTAATIAKWKRQADELEKELEEGEMPPPSGDNPDADEATDDPVDDTVDDDGSVSDEISDDEVRKKLSEIDMQMRRERYMYDAFFKHCCSDRSFVKLKRIVRQDIESHGWGCIEMLRDKHNRLKRLAYVPGYTVRPLSSDGELVEVVEDDSITPLSEDREIVVKRRFQIFVQIVSGKKVYFKSPGDPRVVSRMTGRGYESVEAMRKCEEEPADAIEANELLWISLHSPKTQCPPPRWVGNLLQVLGGREADETNYYYLRNDAIPYGMMFVTGGTIPTDIKERLESRLASEMRGSQGSGKILVVQARPMGKTSADGSVVLPQINFQSLRDAHENDALFTSYDERGGDRIGASFRLPPMLRGYTPSNLNRATAIASITFAESQVFQPERDDMDWIFNQWVVPELGIRYLRMASNSPPTRGVDEMTEIIKSASPHGGLLPNEVRSMVAEMLNKPLAKVKDEWTKQPMVMTLAGIGPDGGPIDCGHGDGEGEFGEGAPATIGELSKKVTNFETRIRSVIAEELASAGIDMGVDVEMFNRPNGDVE